MDAIILNWLGSFGSPVAALVIFLGAAGLPLPTSLVVVASGAMIRQDAMDLFITLGLALLATLLGDSLTYWLGSQSGTRLGRRLGSSANWKKALNFFNQNGGGAVFMTRWLFTSIATPTGVAAGASRYPFARFILLDAAGEFTWLAAYGALGYIFSEQWQQVSQALSTASSGALIALALGVGGFLLIRRLGGLRIRGRLAAARLHPQAR